MADAPPQAPLRARPNAERGRARLAAVQALYQMEMAQTDLNDIVAEFTRHRFGHTVDGTHYDEADEPFFRELVGGMVGAQSQVDPLIARHLAAGWKLARLDATLRAILRAGAFELARRPDVPARSVINEYVDVAHAFFEGDEPGVINGILDALAREARPAEMAG